MALSAKIVTSRIDIKSTAFDILALTFIYFIPALSHLLRIPIYLVEPMRMMLILAMVHTTKRNAYILALTLPVFSFIISAHPNIFKAVIMTGELVLNVWLFFELSRRFSNSFVAMISAIVISKLVYYLMKFSLISFTLIESGLISTPVYLQIITSVIFSGYVFLLFKQNKKSEPA